MHLTQQWQAVERKQKKMSHTEPVALYGQAIKGVLPLPGALLCPLISLLIYRYVRRRLEGGEGLKSRAYLFYRMMCGIFLGQFVCHTFFKGTVYATLKAEIMAAFVIIGFVLIEAAEALARVCGPNKYRAGPRDEDVEGDILVNGDTMEEAPYVEVTALASHETGHKLQAVTDNRYDKRKRRWILLMVFGVFVFVAVVDGLFLVYRNPQDEGTVIGIVVSFYINKMAQTVALCGTMVHAKIHVIGGKRTRIFWWSLITLAWALTVLLSTVPVLNDTAWGSVRDAVENPALAAFFSMAAGAVLWAACYFRQQKLRKIDVRDTVVGIMVFSLAAGQSAVTAIFS